MKKALAVCIVYMVLLLGIGATFARYMEQRVEAQAMANHSFAVSSGFVLANCPSTAVSGFTNWCPTGDGHEYYCLSTTTTCGTSTAGWVLYGGNSPVISVNGKTGAVVIAATSSTTTTLQ